MSNENDNVSQTLRVLMEIRDEMKTLSTQSLYQAEALQKVEERLESIDDRLAGWDVPTHEKRLRRLEVAVFGNGPEAKRTAPKRARRSK